MVAEAGGDAAHTQEVRLAVVMTGGVSLAVWIGGVAREINLLTQATALRHDDAEPVAGTTLAPSSHQVRELYRRLLDLLDVDVTIDVLSGTSAGGINAALLGLANVRRLDLGGLRELWLDKGSLVELLRDPGAKAPPPSLLQGDGRLLAGLREALGRLIGTDGQVPDVESRPTSVFITTTLMRGETARFTDDFGTTVRDLDHHGLFTFTQTQLGRPGIVTPLALAARCTASFPGAFEPGFVPVGEQSVPPLAAYCDMRDHVNTARSHFVADGGLLANRPLGPALRAIFERPADQGQQVRRLMAYVVPTSGDDQPELDEGFDQPSTLSKALLDDLAASMAQTITGDLRAIRDHNRRVSARTDARLRLAQLGAALPRPQRLADGGLYDDFVARESEAVGREVVAEVLRQAGDRADLRDEWAGMLDFGPAAEQLLSAASRAVARRLPSSLPVSNVAAEAVKFGRSAADAAKATVLALLGQGFVLGPPADVRAELVGHRQAVHAALPSVRTARTLAAVVGEVLDNLGQGDRTRSAGDLVGAAAVAAAVWHQQLTDAAASNGPQGWMDLAKVIRTARPLLTDLVEGNRASSAASSPAPGPNGDSALVTAVSTLPSAPGGRSLADARTAAASYIDVFLKFLPDDPDDCMSALLELHVALRALTPDAVVIDQPVELVQLSADTRNLLDDTRCLARQKLTGLQFHHFGAFYKRSWRANDWMWGRLDGCGWLVHLLLDPRRLLVRRDAIDQDPARTPGSASGAQQIRAALTSLAGADPPTAVQTELAFLDDRGDPGKSVLPRSLPQTAQWVAAPLQRLVAGEELACVATQVEADRRAGAAEKQADGFLAAYRNAVAPDATAVPGGTAVPPEDAGRVLKACQVSAETFRGESGSNLLTRTLAQTSAVAAAAVAGASPMPPVLRPATMVIRRATLFAYQVALRTTQGKRATTIWAALGMLIMGALIATSSIAVVGALGLAVAVAGVVLLTLSTTQSVLRAVGALLVALVVIVALAGYVPFAGRHLFGWLGTSALPYLRQHPAAWAGVFLLFLLPFMITFGWALTEIRRPKRPARRPSRRVTRQVSTPPDQPEPATTGEPSEQPAVGKT